MIKETLRQYLGKYAGIRYRIEGNTPSPADIAIIIPIKNEFPGICTTIESLNNCEVSDNVFVTVIGVVNNSEAEEPDIVENNRKSIEFFKSLEYKNKEGNIRVTYIDAASPGKALPQKSAGVGLARKIGMDEGLTLLKNPDTGIIVCLDADCIVNKEYIKQIHHKFASLDLHAAVAMFQHQTDGADEAHQAAILQYEIYIRFYACGLKAVHSPYAYLPVGSTMMFTGRIYMKAEGMNQRKAAEDFYFLEKVAKISPIYSIPEALVYPSGRTSRRVPFGTGPAVEDILAGKRDADKIYNPEIFFFLGKWLQLFYTEELYPADFYLTQAEAIHPGVYSYLGNPVIKREMENFLHHSKPGAGLLKRKIRWFDALKTLRMVHTIRDEFIPDISINESIKKLALLIHVSAPESTSDAIENLTIQRKWLSNLHQADISML